MRTVSLTKFSIIICLLFLLICSSAASSDSARTVHWEFAGWYGGGTFSNSAFAHGKENIVYLTSDIAGIWKSIDLGEKWVPVNKGLRNLIVASG